MQNHTPRAFSLMEILVVCAIIALLLAILLPSISRARDRARTAACANNLRQVGHAMALYESDNRDYAPPRAIAGADYSLNWPGPPHYPSQFRAVWTDQIILGQYLGLTNGDNANPRYIAGNVRRNSALVCPADQFHPVADDMGPSYAMGSNFIYVSPGPRYKNFWKTTKIDNHSMELCVVDGFDISFAPGGWTEPYPFLGSPDTTANRNYNLSPDPNSLYNWSKRHNNGSTNALFLDAHVETLQDLKSPYDRHELTLHQINE